MEPEQPEKIDDYWKNNPTIQEIAITNRKINELLEALVAAKNSLILTSDATKDKIRVSMLTGQGQPLSEGSFRINDVTLISSIKEGNGLIPLLLKALSRGSCNSLKGKCEILIQFFRDLKVSEE